MSLLLLTLSIVFLCAPGWPTLVLRKETNMRRLSRVPAWKSVVKYWPNWTELIRSLLGSACLAQWFSSNRDAHPDNWKPFFFVQLAIITAGIMVQILPAQSRRWILLPVFYIMGMVIVFPGPLVGVFAVLSGSALGVAAGNTNAAMLIAAGVVVLGGVLVGVDKVSLATAGFATLLPFGLGFMLHKETVPPALPEFH